jgi:Ca2+-binding EF-hand superfamily protein
MTDFAANFLKMIQPGVARRDSVIAQARKEFDRNGDGAIGAGEFQRVFAAVHLQEGQRASGGGFHLQPTSFSLRPTLFDCTLFPSYGRNYAVSMYQAQTALTALDADANGSVSEAELFAFGAPKEEPENDPNTQTPTLTVAERADALMAQYDIGAKGYVVIDDVVSVWLANPELGSIADAGNVIATWDADGDGKITRSEVERGFLAMDAADALIAQFGGGTDAVSLDATDALVSALGLAADLVKSWDRDGDMRLSRQDLIAGMRAATAPFDIDKTPAADIAAALLARYDMDASHAITLGEFEKLMGDFDSSIGDASAYFTDWDEDADGAITAAELTSGIDMIQNARKIVADYDLAGKGWFDATDIQAALDQAPAGAQGEDGPAASAADIMAWWDADGDGKVGVREVIAGLLAGGFVQGQQVYGESAAAQAQATDDPDASQKA